MAKGWGKYWNPVTKKRETFKVPGQSSHIDIDEDKIGGDYWKMKGNPMYKAAADALDIDFDKFIRRMENNLGNEKDWKDVEPDKEEFDQVGYDKAHKEWMADEDAGKDSSPNKADFTTSISGKNKYGFSGHTDISDKIGKMDKWLMDTVKTQSQYDAPRIARGLKPSDYGMEGDNIFKALGIHKAPGSPKELDVSYDMELTEANPSDVTYQTPSEYTPVDLHA